MVENNTEISQKLKSKSQLSREEKYYKIQRNKMASQIKTTNGFCQHNCYQFANIKNSRAKIKTHMKSSFLIFLCKYKIFFVWKIISSGNLKKFFLWGENQLFFSGKYKKFFLWVKNCFFEAVVKNFSFEKLFFGVSIRNFLDSLSVPGECTR